MERKSERKVAPQALITSGGLLKLECLRLSSPSPLRDNYYQHYVVLFASFYAGACACTRYATAYAPCTRTSTHVRIRQRSSLVLEIVKDPVVSYRRGAAHESSQNVFFSLSLALFLSRPDISAKSWKNFPQRMTREREYLLSRVYLLRKQKFRFLLRASAELISFPRTIINRISLHNYFVFILRGKIFP